jgi:tight adherence protein B
MGAVVGLLFGLGLLLIWQARSSPRTTSRTSTGRGLDERAAELLAQAGLAAVTARQLYAGMAASGTAVFVLATAISRSVPIALAFAAFAAHAPLGWLRRRRRLRTVELRELWPDVVDNLNSAIRAGLSLPEAVAALGSRGPEPLRGSFRRFGDDFRATGRFGESLDLLKARLADPAADRIIESLRLARDVGGHALGRLLRTLAQFLRDDARTRAELETRQGWTVNAARLALAAPWIVIALLAARPTTVAAYNTAAGVLVLLAGGLVSLTAYRIMLRIARLPLERRVLR